MPGLDNIAWETWSVISNLSIGLRSGSKNTSIAIHPKPSGPTRHVGRLWNLDGLARVMPSAVFIVVDGHSAQADALSEFGLREPHTFAAGSYLFWRQGLLQRPRLRIL
jgi:hypothetical protein